MKPMGELQGSHAVTIDRKHSRMLPEERGLEQSGGLKIVDGYAAAVAKHPSDIGRRLKWVRELANHGCQREAQAALREGLALLPHAPRLLAELSAQQRRQGRLKAAQKTLQLLAKHHPDDPRLPQLRAAHAIAAGDFEEAERVYAVATAARPDDEGLRLRWARCLARMGRLIEAQTALAEGLASAPDSADLLAERTLLLNQMGQVETARVALTALEKQHPGHSMLPRLLRSANKLGGDAVATERTYAAAVKAQPRNVAARLRLARHLRKLGRHDEALSVLSEGLARAPDSAELLAQQTYLLGKTGQFEAARVSLRSLSKHHPGHPQIPQFRGVQAEAGGDLDDAQAIFAADAAAHPEDPTRRVRWANSLRKSGRIADALRILAEPVSPNAIERKLRIECLLETGQWEEVPKLLDAWPDTGRHEDWLVKSRLRMRLAILTFEHGAALEQAKAMLAVAPDNISAGIGFTRAAAATFQPELAWKALVHIPRKSPNGGAPRRGAGALRSLVGQIVNDLRLKPQETGHLAAAAERGEEALIETAGAQLRSGAGNFAAALGLLIGLARTGGFAQPLSSLPQAGSRIPKVLHQFWDTEAPPQDVQSLMARTKDVNGDFSYRRWNDADARRFLTVFGQSEPLLAYRTARHPAMKADLFRLAVLYVEGGVYLDADDYCAAPLSTLLSPDVEFCCYQDEFCSIGNNFLAATPRHPLIGAALREATQSVIEGATESLWLVTGPGLMSRIVAGSIAWTPDLRPSPGLMVLPLRTFHSVVHPHRRVSYKADTRHWIRAG